MVTRKKKTSADYEADIKKAEDRVKELKRKAAQATKAEQARHNAIVLKSLQNYFAVMGKDWNTADKIIDDWTEKYKQKHYQQ